MSDDSHGVRRRTHRAGDLAPNGVRALAGALAAALVVASGPAPAAAQSPDASRTPAPAVSPAAPDSTGWLGVGLQAVRCTEAGTVEPNCARALVGSVIVGSPAHEAGIREGDEILSVDGERVRRGVRDPTFRTMRPGSPLQMVVRREGREVSLTVTPRVRPDSLAVVRLVHTDPPRAVPGAYVLAVPEVRLRLESLSFPELPGVPSQEGVSPRLLRVVSTERGGELSRELVAARVGALRQAMGRARAEAEAVSRGMTEVVQDRMTAERGEGGEGVEVRVSASALENEAVDRAARQWRTWIDDSLRGRLEHLHDSVLAVARGHMDSLAVRGVAPFVFSSGGEGGSGVMVFGGDRHRVAGAEFEPMSPELAEFFPGSADGGLLVLRVLPETPAARLGLRPGDVVVEAGGRACHSVTSLRSALSERDIVVKWMRKGELMSARVEN